MPTPSLLPPTDFLKPDLYMGLEPISKIFGAGQESPLKPNTVSTSKVASHRVKNLGDNGNFLATTAVSQSLLTSDGYLL